MGNPDLKGKAPPDQRWFATTHWSVVLAARDESPDRAQQALEKLCQTYWYPLYVFARRHGLQPADAEDAVQGLFQQLFERDFLSGVSELKGRFRSFLLACLRNFLAEQKRKAAALKRGGGSSPISLDQLAAEQRFQNEPAEYQSLELCFDRQWAVLVVSTVLDRLGAETAAAGKGQLFEQLRGSLAGEKATPPIAELASRLGLSEAGVRGAVYRLRERYRELFREEIMLTVSSPEEVDQEIRYLCEVLLHQAPF